MYLPDLHFQPSEYDAEVFETIKAKREASANKNATDPIRIDLTDE